MITIKKLTTSANFRYLWLKTVEGVKLSEHCAKCLVGSYEKGIGSTTKELTDLALGGDIYYLCGVSTPYKWENNFHLAFAKEEGSTVEYESNGISVVIENARRLPISTEYIDEADPNAGKKQYSTCRNWQFAHYYAKHLNSH